MIKQSLSFAFERERESSIYSLKSITKGAISSIAISSLLVFSGCGGGDSDQATSSNNTDKICPSTCCMPYSGFLNE